MNFEWVTNSAPTLTTLAIAMARMAAAFLVVPFFQTQFMTGIARNTVIIALSLILWPVVYAAMPVQPMGTLTLLALLVKEVVLGTLIGFVVSLPFWAADSVGFFIDNQKGTTLASVFNPLSGEQTSPTGLFFVQIVTTLFFTAGGFLLFLGGLYESYGLFPVFTFWPEWGPDFPTFFLHFADHLGKATVLYAAPVIIALFLSEFGLGLMNRFAQQLNVFSLSMGVKAAVSSFVLVVYMVFLFLFFKDSMLDGQKMLKLFEELLLR